MTSQPLVELQITTSAFLAAQLLNLQTQNLPFPSAFTEGSYQFVIDHVEFGKNTLLNSTPSQKPVYNKEPGYGLVSQEVNGFRPQISQPIKVVVVSLADVESNPNGIPSHPIAINATMIPGLNYYIAAIGQDVLTIVVDSVELAPLPLLPPGVNPTDIQNKFMDFVQSFGRQTLHLNLAHSALKGNINVINTGMSVSSDLQRIAFRQELDGGIEGDPGIWQEFYSGDFDDRLQNASGRDQAFAVFESADVLEDVAADQISEDLASQAQSQAEKPQAVYFQLLTGVGSNYSNNGGAPTITSTFSGNLNTPLCSVRIDVTVVSVLSVVAPNTVTVDTSYSWNTETSACTIVAGVLGTALGIFTDFVLPMGSLIVEPVFFAISGMVGVLVAKNVAAPSSFSMDSCQQVSDTHLICTQPVGIQDSALGKLSMTGLQAQDDGISILGNLAPVLVGNPQIATSVDSDFVWNTPSISCGEAGESTIVSFRRNPQAWVTLTASASVTAQGLAPVFLISATVIEDPLGVFSRSLVVQGTQAPIQLSFNLGYPGDQYFANPYPCRILVLTTGGARLISIPHPLRSPRPLFNKSKEKL